MLYIEPDSYPYYDTIVLREPPGVTLKTLFAQAGGTGTVDDPLPVVISSNLDASIQPGTAYRG